MNNINNSLIRGTVLILGNYHFYHGFYLEYFFVPTKLTLHLHPLIHILTRQSLSKENMVSGWIFLLLLRHIKHKYGKREK